MELIWWGAAILGMTLLAAGIGLALLRPDTETGLRPLANTGRLTRLPEYTRAVRRRALGTIISIFLLAVAFTATLLAVARPTGLPTVAGHAETGQPEDIMVCIAGPVDEPSAGQTLSYFAERVHLFGTERVGLTSANRRVIPLTRDYQYAAAQFGSYAQAAERRGDDLADFVTPVRYVDYAVSAQDTLAMCLTGFVPFDEPAPQRRSIIYIGPGAFQDAGADQSLFTAEQLSDMATTAGVQVNALYTSSGGQALDALARDTGGQSQQAGADLTVQLDDIRSHPPSPAVVGTTAVRRTETPDVPIIMALAAMLTLALWPLVRRS